MKECSNNNSRIFYHKDVATIEGLVTAMNKKNVKLEQAINRAMSSVEENEIATFTTDSVADTEHELHHMRVIRNRYLS